MRTIPIIQLGTGNVGKEVIRQVMDINRQNSSTRFCYIGLANSKAVLFKKEGFSETMLDEIISRKESFTTFFSSSVKHNGDIAPLISSIDQSAMDDISMIDTTDTDLHLNFLRKCAEKGLSLVLANKKPLIGDMKTFRLLTREKLGCRATVGAGLPVIPVLSELKSKGKNIAVIQGCFSGSMGILCTSMEKGELFSNIVNDLYSKGITEPDPREDLSGIDLARKVLILTRLSGRSIEMEDIQMERLFPEELATIPLKQFLSEIKTLDNHFNDLFTQAAGRGSTFRFVATFSKRKCNVGLREVSRESHIGKLTGADKLALIYTECSPENPVLVKGAGAGATNAARDVVEDLLEVVQH